MEYRSIVAVTGLAGLYQLVSTKNDGAFVRNLADKTIKFVSARVHHITPLESIEIYTTGENVRLHEVLEGIKANDSAYADLVAKKTTDAEFKNFFGVVLPNFDQERVYTSDIKKIYKWYEILKGADLLNFDFYYQQPNLLKAEDVVLEEDAPVEAPIENVVAEKPKKAAKKA